MRMRCPTENCLIAVHDDFVGEPIRCPHCGALMEVDSNDQDPEAVQIQAGEPQVTGPKRLEGADLASQIYDGVPPLAVMMARRRRGGFSYDDADFASKYEMTDDDWRALDAYEALLWAGSRVRAALVLGGAGALMNLVVLMGMVTVFGETDLGDHARSRALGNLGTFLFLPGGLALTWLAGEKFCRLQPGRLTLGLPWITLAVALVLVGSAGLNLLTLSGLGDGRVVFLTLASAGVSGLAAFAALAAFLGISSAQARVRPPEINHRLTEAMKYLD